MSGMLEILGPADLSRLLAGDPPIAVRAIDLELGGAEIDLPASRSGWPYRGVLALVREGRSPIGWAWLPASEDGRVSWSTPQGRRVAPTEAAEPSGPAADELMSVVIATCAKPERVAACVEAILAGAAGPVEVVVVENRPRGSEVPRFVEDRFGPSGNVRCVEEERPGLGAARNAGLRDARGDLVAFTDDDVLVDPGWMGALRGAFAMAARPDCVTGLIAPLEFESPAQLLDERFASYGKGFDRRTYSLAEPPAAEPLFPYAAGHFASGANLAFRTAALRELGGFDPCLGTGTRSRGGEDLDVCLRVLLDGRTLVYEPAATIWHRHPDTHSHVRRQVFDYGAALGAMATKHALASPGGRELLRRIPAGLRYYVSPRSRKNEKRGSGFPRDLVMRERAGLLYGPIAYAASALEGSLAWRGR